MRVSFAIMGGKSRIANWLCNHFPLEGNTYLELFAGRGNVFFTAINKLQYSQWILNDKYEYKFLNALNNINIELLPDEMNDQLASHYKSFPGSNVAKVIEPLITFGGKGYQHGFKLDNRKRYNKLLLSRKIKLCKVLFEINKVNIWGLNWKCALSKFKQCLNENDFVYCDPPYYETKASYPNISHYELICELNELKCKWAISGYDNSLYRDELKYENKYTIERNAEIKGSLSLSNGTSRVLEHLWTNY